MTVTSEQPLGDCVLPALMLPGGWGDFSTPISPAKGPRWALCWRRAQVSPGRGTGGLECQAGSGHARSDRCPVASRSVAVTISTCRVLWEVAPKLGLAKQAGDVFLST